MYSAMNDISFNYLFLDMPLQVISRHTFHAEYFDMNTISTRQSIRNILDCFPVNILQMNNQTAGSRQLSVTEIALEMLCFLMVDKDLVVVKLYKGGVSVVNRREGSSFE